MKQRKKNRHSQYDYSAVGYYFVTICCADHKDLFGDIFRGAIRLNRIGKIVDNNWRMIETLHKGIELDEYIIMPNHIHGIIIITEDYNETSHEDDRTKMTLSKLIAQFKRQCTIDVKQKFNFTEKLWQRSFYDRIIRNDKELYRIRKYIIQNPLKWEIEKGDFENLDI